MDYDGMDLGPALRRVYGAVPAAPQLKKLRGDASTRTYYRLHAADRTPNSLIVMRLPAGDLCSDEGGGGPALEQLPFIDVQRHLHERGVRVPEVLVDDSRARGVVLLEDLGDETFEARLHATPTEQWETLYRQAVDVLVALQRSCREPGDCVAYQRSFDRELLRWELDHFLRWGLEATGHAPSDSQRAVLERAFDWLVDRLLALPQGFVHRDFQSRNLMWGPAGELVVIDFQDALLGPSLYDLVALLCDSYVTLPEPLQRALIAHYAEAAGLSTRTAEGAFWAVAAHRKLKDAGRFVFIDQVRGNPDFLPWYGPSLLHVGRAVEAVGELRPVGEVLGTLLPGFPDRVAAPARATGACRSRAD